LFDIRFLYVKIFKKKIIHQIIYRCISTGAKCVTLSPVILKSEIVVKQCFVFYLIQILNIHSFITISNFEITGAGGNAPTGKDGSHLKTKGFVLTRCTRK